MQAFIFILGLVITINSIGDCAIDDGELAAKYTISREPATDSQPATHYTMNIWRYQGQVAHEHPKSQITDIWSQTPNGMIRPIRYFDAYQRAVEYQPNEFNKGKGDTHWSVKNQLIDERLKSKMVLDKTEGTGCDRKAYYHLAKGNQSFTLVWQPALNLVVRYQHKTMNLTETWQLSELITNKSRIKAFYSVRQGYKSTDFIDIGDNESDPFFMKMINLGFVEHHGSGFYNANGEPIESEQAHGHHQHGHKHDH